MHLQCLNNCEEGRFEALNAPMYVDRAGRYLRHEKRAATYRCATCSAIAIDVAAAARMMQRDRTAMPLTITCPACRTAMLPPEDDPLATLVECPECGQRFSPEEGQGALHGGGRLEPWAIDEMDAGES